MAPVKVPASLAGTRARLGDRTLTSSFAASGSIQLLNLVTGVLLARVLGAEGRGELAAVILWPTLLAAVGSLGVMEATVYRAATGAELRDLTGAALALAAVQSAVIAAIGLVVLPLVLDGGDPGTLTSGYLFLLFVPLNLGTVYLLGILNGRERYAAFNVLRVAVIALSALGLVGLAVADELTVRNAVVAYLAANLLTLGGTVLAVAPLLAGPPRASREEGRRLLRYGVRAHLSSTSSLLNERVDQLVISVALAPVALGLYVVAVTTTAVTNLVGTTVSLLALPAVAAASASEAAAVARRHLRVTLVLSVLVTVPLLVLAPQIVELAFGEEFLDAVDPARILLVAAALLALGRSLGAVLKGANRPLDAGLAELLALGVTAVGLAVLLSPLGIEGAAVTSLVAYAVSALFMLQRSARRLGVPVRELVLAP